MKVSAIKLSNKLYSFKSQNKEEIPRIHEQKKQISTSNIILGSAAIAATTAAIIFGIKYNKLNKNTKEVIEATKEKLQKDFDVVKDGSETILKLAQKNEDKFNKLSDKEINALLSDITKIEGNIVLEYKNKIEAPKLKEINGTFIAKGVKTLNLPNLEKVGDNFALTLINELQAQNLKIVEGRFLINSLKNTSFDNLESSSSLLISNSNGIKLNKFTKLKEIFKDKSILCISGSDDIEINNINSVNSVHMSLCSNISMPNYEKGVMVLNGVYNSKFSNFSTNNAIIITAQNITFKDKTV